MDERQQSTTGNELTGQTSSSSQPSGETKRKALSNPSEPDSKKNRGLVTGMDPSNASKMETNARSEHMVALGVQLERSETIIRSQFDRMARNQPSEPLDSDDSASEEQEHEESQEGADHIAIGNQEGSPRLSAREKSVLKIHKIIQAILKDVLKLLKKNKRELSPSFGDELAKYSSLLGTILTFLTGSDPRKPQSRRSA